MGYCTQAGPSLWRTNNPNSWVLNLLYIFVDANETGSPRRSSLQYVVIERCTQPSRKANSFFACYAMNHGDHKDRNILIFSLFCITEFVRCTRRCWERRFKWNTVLAFCTGGISSSQATILLQLPSIWVDAMNAFRSKQQIGCALFELKFLQRPVFMGQFQDMIPVFPERLVTRNLGLQLRLCGDHPLHWKYTRYYHHQAAPMSQLIQSAWDTHHLATV